MFFFVVDVELSSLICPRSGVCRARGVRGQRNTARCNHRNRRIWTSPLVEAKTPATAHAARTMMLIPPYSAAAERTFPLLDALFGDLQQSAAAPMARSI